jgi:YgiT-type zinc finger domain-containing protein
MGSGSSPTEEVMRKRYNKCHFCGGRVTEQRVVVDYRWGENLLAIIEDVPAGVCHTCGERYFKAEVVKAMEETAQSRSRARRTIEVPVRQLKAAVLAGG